jgi:GNAT superfamily N-acetyltransferase
MKTISKQINTTEKISLTGRYLKPEDIPEIMKLQDVIAEGLTKAGTPRHIVKRSQEYFLKHLLSPHAMFGMVTENAQVVAQSIFRVSDVNTKEELYIDCLPDMKENDRLSIAQGVLVHPDYQGYGLMQVMLGKWIQWCEKNEIRHLAARTESSHHTSQKGFLKNNFNKVATIIDPKDNAEVCVLHRILDDQAPCLEKAPQKNLQGFKELIIDFTCS